MEAIDENFKISIGYALFCGGIVSAVYFPTEQKGKDRNAKSKRLESKTT
jgi:hypothetical protein